VRALLLLVVVVNGGRAVVDSGEMGVVQGHDSDVVQVRVSAAVRAEG
jgi:hypothetical protein